MILQKLQETNNTNDEKLGSEFAAQGAPCMAKKGLA